MDDTQGFVRFAIASSAKNGTSAFRQGSRPVFDRLVENEQQAQTLTTLRDTLLPRLISGQLRLPDAEAVVEEVGAH
jgi:type I restriction enzyme S subunit